MYRPYVLIFILSILAVSAFAETAPEASKFKYKKPAIPTGDEVIFVETFDDPDSFAKNWVISEHPAFEGEWKLTEGFSEYAFDGDLTLSSQSPAKKHAISTKFPKVFDPTDKDTVIQFEVRSETDKENRCNGAYIKLLTVNESRSLENYNDKTPFTIMFGPDQCGGANDKVHFIFRHLHPITKVWEEKACYLPPHTELKDTRTRLYTLHVMKNNSFEIYIDQKVRKSGNLLVDIIPHVNPHKDMIDPDDFKPADWDDREKIPDPNAEKPADWDLPEYIPDPEAVKPEDWDDDFDGEWEVPLIKNPEYRGEWVAPFIPNPNYKGEWKPRLIPNIYYFEDLHPHNFAPMDALGIDIWTMEPGITYNNIIITTNKQIADDFAAQTWVPRRAEEDRLYEISHPKEPEPGFLDNAKKYLETLYLATQKEPIYLVMTIVGGLVPIIALFFCCGGKKSKTTATTSTPKENLEKSPKIEEIEDEDEDEDKNKGKNNLKQRKTTKKD